MQKLGLLSLVIALSPIPSAAQRLDILPDQQVRLISEEISAMPRSRTSGTIRNSIGRAAVQMDYGPLRNTTSRRRLSTG